MSAGAARRPLAGAALVAVFVALCLWPALDPARQFGARDNGRMHLPVKAFLAAELAQGRLAEWNPYAGLGTPVLGNAVDAPLHPFNLLLVLLPFDWGFKAWVALSVLLGGLGAGALARRLGADEGGARLGALAFALTGFLLSSTDNVTYLTAAATVPWLLAAGLWHAEGGGPGRLLGVLLASFLLAAAGDPISWAAALAALPPLAWVAGQTGRPRAGAARPYAALLVALLGGAPVVLPLLLALPASSRATALAPIELTRWNLHPARLAELAVPFLSRSAPGALVSPAFQAFFGNEATPVPWALSLYAGAAVLALAAVGASRGGAARGVLALAALVAWAAAGPHLGFAALAGHLPVLSSIRYWERLGGLLALALAVAAALGATALLDRPPSRRLRLGLAAAAAAALLAAAALSARPEPVAAWLAARAGPAAALELVGNAEDGLWHAGAALAALALLAAGLARGRLASVAPWLLAGLVGADLLGANAGASVLVALDAVRPAQPLAAALRREGGLPRVATPLPAGALVEGGDTPFEAVARANARLLEGPSAMPAGVGNLAPYTSLVPARLAELQRRLGADGLARVAGRFSVTHLAVPGDPAAALARLGLPASLPVVATDPAGPATLLALPHRPRAYLADQVRPASAEEALAFALAPEAPGLGAVVEGPVPAGAEAGATGEVTIEREEAGLVVLRLAASRPALLVLDDLFAPGWSAELDGREEEVFRVNDLVRGVFTGAGAHRVVFRYRAPGLRLGLALLLAAALGLAAAALRARPGRL